MTQPRALFPLSQRPTIGPVSPTAHGHRARPSLRQEIESLISARESDDRFLEDPAARGILDRILPKPGDTLGRYRIVEQIGEGAMAVVYRAQDQLLKRDVAIKVFFASVAADPEALGRFEREAQAVAAISHPNIMALHDFCNDGGIWYVVTELLKGETLRVRLARGPLPVTK
ncbi:MAG: protein kinase, partial [Planctomycetota bacterium]